MSAVDAWMPLYIGDYLADTRRLNTTEHGAYMLLLMEQWRRGWIPDDEQQLARLTGLRLDHWRKAAGNLLPYFDAGSLPGTLRQKRLHAEREKALAISAKRADAARAKAAAVRSVTEGGGGHGANSAHETEPDFAPKPLENLEAQPASAQQVQPVCIHSHNHNNQEKKEKEVEPPFPPAPLPVALAKPKAVAAAPLPDWLPPESWSDWCAFRAARPKRAPWNQNTAALCVKTLGKLRDQGHDPSEVIEQSIVSGWTGLFPVKGGSGRQQANKLDWVFDDANFRGGHA